jgi:hypothetical protein
MQRMRTPYQWLSFLYVGSNNLSIFQEGAASGPKEPFCSDERELPAEATNHKFPATTLNQTRFCYYLTGVEVEPQNNLDSSFT